MKSKGSARLLITRHLRSQIIRSQSPSSVPVPSFPFLLPMAASVRVRRPPSPPPQQIYTPPPTQPRFPHPKHEHLDADERRTQASKPYFAGRRTNPGGLNVTSAEWKLLILVVVVACFVRLFRISYPNSVVWVPTSPFSDISFYNLASTASMRSTSASLPQSISKPSSSWTCTRRWQNS